MKPGNRGIRGIRHPIPAATLIGRQANGGSGAPQYITFAELARAIASLGGIVSTTGLTPIPAVPQFISATGSVPLLSGITQRVCDIFLPDGTWDLSASVTFDPNGAAVSSFSDAVVAISQSPSLLPTPPNGGGYAENTHAMSITGSTTVTTAVMRLVITSPGPVWLLAQATFA